MARPDANVPDARDPAAAWDAGEDGAPDPIARDAGHDADQAEAEPAVDRSDAAQPEEPSATPETADDAFDEAVEHAHASGMRVEQEPEAHQVDGCSVHTGGRRSGVWLGLLSAVLARRRRRG